jgi:adenine specific DNA methylase Mod
MTTKPRCWIEVLSSLRDFELLGNDLPSHKWLGYFQQKSSQHRSSPFCGCGTTIHAAQKLGRQWIGIDVTYLAINLIKRRLKDAFGEEVQFEEKGQPTDFGSAKALAELDKWQFQQWALSLIDARPRTEGDGFLESVPAVSAKLKAPLTADRKFEDVVKSARDAAVLVLVY